MCIASCICCAEPAQPQSCQPFWQIQMFWGRAKVAFDRCAQLEIEMLLGGFIFRIHIQNDSEYPMEQRRTLALTASFIHKLCLGEVGPSERTAWLCNGSGAIHEGERHHPCDSGCSYPSIILCLELCDREVHCCSLTKLHCCIWDKASLVCVCVCVCVYNLLLTVSLTSLSTSLLN